MTNIAIFATGSGSNAESIIQFFKNNASVHVAMVLTNNPEAGVFERCQRLGIHCQFFDNEAFKNGTPIVQGLKAHQVDMIVLAGFLRKISLPILEAYPDRILNIHPALLPDYGGKGMYGMHVHRAVFKNNEQESGITIHLVNEKYDEGKHLLQEKVDVRQSASPEEIQQKVLALEHYWFPRAIERYINQLQGVD